MQNKKKEKTIPEAKQTMKKNEQNECNMMIYYNKPLMQIIIQRNQLIIMYNNCVYWGLYI